MGMFQIFLGLYLLAEDANFRKLASDLHRWGQERWYSLTLLKIYCVSAKCQKQNSHIIREKGAVDTGKAERADIHCLCLSLSSQKAPWL